MYGDESYGNGHAEIRVVEVWNEKRIEQEHIEKMMREIELMDQGGAYRELLVNGAVMGCQYGNRFSKIEKKTLEYAYVGFDEVLLDKDRPEETFGVCHSPYLSESDRNNQITVVISASENKKYRMRHTETGPACMMKLSQEWKSLGKKVLIFDWDDETYHYIPTTQSYLVCYHGNGCVFPVDAGQKPVLEKTVGEKVVIDGTNNQKEDWDPTSAKVRTLTFISCYPLVAIKIGKVKTGKGNTNISTNSVRFASGLELGEPEENEKEGTQVNAFRHTLWQATITSRFGSEVATEIGNAHEENPYSVEVISEKYGINYVQFATLSLADEAADLLNNIAGRSLGTGIKNYTMKEMAQNVLDYYYNIGLWTSVKMDNGNYEVRKLKLSRTKYDNAVLLLSEMDGNGFPPGNEYYNAQGESSADTEESESP